MHFLQNKVDLTTSRSDDIFIQQTTLETTEPGYTDLVKWTRYYETLPRERYLLNSCNDRKNMYSFEYHKNTHLHNNDTVEHTYNSEHVAKTSRRE